MKRVKIADLLNMGELVNITPDSQIMVRALNLSEMIQLLMEESNSFLALYAKGMEGNLSAESLAPFLVASPGLVAKIISIATDEAGTEETIEKYMAFSVQLIALEKIWRLSIPDPKKLQELLSVVMALLQKHSKENQGIELIQPKDSQETLPKP